MKLYFILFNSSGEITIDNKKVLCTCGGIEKVRLDKIFTYIQACHDNNISIVIYEVIEVL